MKRMILSLYMNMVSVHGVNVISSGLHCRTQNSI